MSQAGNLLANREIVHVLVADSTPLTGRLIADSLRRDRGLEVTEASGNALLTTTARLNSDVTILSAQLEGKKDKGFEVLKQLRLVVPRTRVVMLLDCDDRESVVAAFRGGARGVFSRDNPLKMLVRCVHKVYAGQLWVSSRQLEFLLETIACAPATRLVDTKGAALLSKREQDVVRWLAEGLTNSQIASELNLGKNTVKNYLFRIYNKLGVSSRVEVVLYAANQNTSVNGILDT
jgi:two-component system, NarL family, nitrate/nitrite response regulator NarL